MTRDENNCPPFMNKEHQVTQKYMWTGKKHRDLIERSISSTGVYRSQHQMLMSISDSPNVSQKELAVKSKVSAATVAVSLKKLEKGGYIRRVVDERDNRYNQLCLTEKGKQVVEKSKQIFMDVDKSMFDGFSPEELEKMEEFLDRMYENLEKKLRD